MTKYTDAFFVDEMSLKRRDGHVANGLVPTGTHVYQDLSDMLEKTITPPADAVAFYGNLIIPASTTVRYTLDGVTSPTSTVGFNSIPAGSPIYIKPGTAIRVIGTAAGQAMNVQWLGSV